MMEAIEYVPFNEAQCAALSEITRSTRVFGLNANGEKIPSRVVHRAFRQPNRINLTGLATRTKTYTSNNYGVSIGFCRMTSTSEGVTEAQVWFLICDFISNSRAETQAVLPQLENGLVSSGQLLPERSGNFFPSHTHIWPAWECSCTQFRLRICSWHCARSRGARSWQQQVPHLQSSLR